MKDTILNFHLRDTLYFDILFDDNYDFLSDFRDVNFDGFHDYVQLVRYQNAWTNNFKIYTFNDKLKIYEFLLEGYESYTGIVERRMGEKRFVQC